MEIFIKEAIGFCLTLMGALGSIIVWLHKRSDKKIDQVARDLSQYKEQQAREAEAHRIRNATEMSRLESRLEGVSVAIKYINENIQGIQHSIGTIAQVLQNRDK